MSRYYYFADIKDAVSLSEKHNSDYSQVCLDYIPGSAIAGALAAVMYRDASMPQAVLNDLFQNGRTIFSNCLPLKSSPEGDNDSAMEVVLPAPSCLHYEKGRKEGETDYINLTCGEIGEKQLKQVRAGYINSKCEKFSIKKNSVTKTAIDCNTYGASEGKLYNMSFIEKGTVFWGYIDLPETIPEKTLTSIKDFLNSEIRVGKSRSNEFGRVKLSLMPEKEADKIKSWEKPAGNKGKDLFIWCLSDIEFIDTENGMSTYIPQISNLWISGITGTFESDSSFIRTASVRLFNRKRNGFEGEKCLVKKGSILHFLLKVPLTDTQLQKLNERGIGISRHQGLGRVLVNPSWINNENIHRGTYLFNHLSLTKDSGESKENKQSCQENEANNSYDYLLNFIKGYEKHLKYESMYTIEVQQLKEKIADLYEKARTFNNKLQIDCYGQQRTELEPYGPTKTQWGILVEAIRTGGSKNNKLSDDSNKEIFNSIKEKLKNEKYRESSKNSWDVYFSYNERINTTFAREFMNIIADVMLESLRRVMDQLMLFDLASADQSDFKNFKNGQ